MWFLEETNLLQKLKNCGIDGSMMPIAIGETHVKLYIHCLLWFFASSLQVLKVFLEILFIWSKFISVANRVFWIVCLVG